ncbi:MAG: protein-export membrane protein SecD [Gammaproteobacteria bacterium RIFOXYA12_FULL_61_12]|nr:MAG: protein-export membrane protein SecD [Gammaproteobacteria bacterium RIFOXYA12_FULL_61_12]OGT91310.1 MAG: protein-export membrane protein SecD [Gammaproteobacteria bacterium RIFOXYD12_FULL_61_37]
MNRYPLWKNLLVLFVLLFCGLLALPNIYDQDPSIEIAPARDAVVDPGKRDSVEQLLKEAKIGYKSVRLLNNRLMLHFPDSDSQLKAQEWLQGRLGDGYTQAMTLSPDLPEWVMALGLKPMYLGLDLRGGIHVLIDVDMDAAQKQAVERYMGDIRTYLREQKLRYSGMRQEGEVGILSFKEAPVRDQAASKLGGEFRNLQIETEDLADSFNLRFSMSKADQISVKKFALQQNITTLRNRVNSLGVAEPVIQQEGDRRIVVQLPGAQDPSKLKEILGATATLEYRLVDAEHSVEDAMAGKVPPGSRLYKSREGRPVLLKKQVIVTGNQITDAASGFDSRDGTPMVTVSLDGQGARRMRNVTTENVGQPMAVVFIENRTTTSMVDGKAVKKKEMVEEVISIATIREPFGARFQTTGLDSPAESRDLALLLRAGALAAPIEIAEERTVGPSLGQDNIDQGFISVVVGLGVVMVFMVVYYKVFGVLANLALMLNVVMIVAVLSVLQATLTLPGIAGIVLTVGMAVDANVLIYERIREELRLGNSPQASIYAGYEKAFMTILDSNLTTLIVAIVLFGFGTGPVKGFAVVLFIGILTSMFTAIMVTRAVTNLVYGSRRIEKLHV